MYKATRDVGRETQHGMLYEHLHKGLITDY